MATIIKTNYFGFPDKKEGSEELIKNLNEVLGFDGFEFSNRMIRNKKNIPFHNLEKETILNIHSVFFKSNCKFGYSWFSDSQGAGHSFYEDKGNVVETTISLDSTLSKLRLFIDFLISCGMSQFLEDILFSEEVDV